MIEKERHIKEIYDLNHRKDNIETGFDYENNILKKTLSSVLYKNENMAAFLEEFRKPVVWMIDSVSIVRNFWNYTIDKNFSDHID